MTYSWRPMIPQRCFGLVGRLLPLVLLMAATGVLAWPAGLTAEEVTPAARSGSAAAEESQTEEATKPAVYPLAVMIDNFPAARPQTGLAAADIVYEALAEGGI